MRISSKWSLFSSFRTRSMYACLFSPMRATCHAHCITLNFNKIFSVQQPRQVVQWRVSDFSSIIAVLVTRTEMVLEMSAYSPLNHLTRLVAQKCYIEFSRSESLLKLCVCRILSTGHFVSTNNESHRYAMLSSLLLRPPSYVQASPSVPYELSKTLGLCYFLNMRDQVSHPHTKTGTIIVLRM